MDDRQQHLAWCKARALEYLDAGDLASAVTSMASDLGKYESTGAIHPALMALGMRAIIAKDADEVRRWIEGFN